jgi:hypothetical protein
MVVPLATSPARAAEYQFSVPVNDKTHKTARAWLYIPPAADHIDGIIWGNQVILEKRICDDPQIRAVARKRNLAIVITADTNLTQYPYNDPEVPRTFRQIRHDLAAVSGYDEIAFAPILPVGHSGGALFCWNLAYEDPSKVIAIVPVHAAAIDAPSWDPKKTADGVPALCITGQYEYWADPDLPLEHHVNWLRGGLLNFRGQRKAALVSMLMQPGATHFNWDDRLASTVAMFIDKAVAARVPPSSSVPTTRPTLQPIDPNTGTLTDIQFLRPPTFPPVAARDFKGDPTLAFWHVDNEIATAIDTYNNSGVGKQDQRLAFVQDGKTIPPAWMNEYRFVPESDGVTVRVAATFLDQTPTGAANSGLPLSHAPGPIKFRLIGGWGGGGEQVGPDRFRIRYDHFGITRRTANIQVMAYHEGDEHFLYAEQPAQIKLPEKLTTGTPQTITFPELPDVPEGSPPIRLTATSSSGLPVYYFIREGPADITGDTLTLLPVPKRVRVPIAITVTAWQLGRADPTSPIQTAEPVTRTFRVLPSSK